MNFFNELKRRNIFKVAGAYLVVGWLLIESSSGISERLSLPAWLPNSILLIVLSGFPIIMLLAWFFEITEDGIKRSSHVAPEQSLSKVTGKKLEYFIIIMLIITAGYFVYESRFTDHNNITVEATQAQSVSIAVLPFVNMSSDVEQEFFSDGLTEEILNTLVRINGLKVAARTSSFAYKGQTPDVREAGRALGVDNIVEGSVRRDPTSNQIRITAQLIRVEDGFHLYSESFDRTYENIFAIQEEIAIAISNALQVPLGFSAGNLVKNRTSNMAAYDQYLQARELIRQRDEGVSKAIEILESVTEREPNFAPAWASLSIAYDILPLYVDIASVNAMSFPRISSSSHYAAARAVALDPELAEARRALGNVYSAQNRWSDALEQHQEAYKLDPSSPEIIEDLAEILSDVGFYEQSITYAKLGVEMSPNLPLANVALADTYYAAGQYEDALKYSDITLQLQPRFSWPFSIKFSIFISQGRLGEAIEMLESCRSCLAFYIADEDMDAVIAALSTNDVKAYESLVSKVAGFHELAYYIGGEEKLLDYIESWAYEKPSNYYFTGLNSPEVRSILHTQRYKKIVLSSGLPTFWRKHGWPKFCHPLGEYDFECGEFE